MKRSKSPTQNSSLLLGLFPAAILLAAYAVLYAMPAQQEYRENLQLLKSIRLNAVDQAAAESSKQSLQLAQSGLQKLNEEVTAHRYEIKTRSQNWRDPDTRLETVHQVTELLRQFNLSIVFQEFETAPTLSNYLNELVQIIDEHSSDSPLEYWQIQLEGGYMDVHDFLVAVQSTGIRIFPISLSMKASSSGNKVHSWTIVLVV